jgi:hypothetical protein
VIFNGPIYSVDLGDSTGDAVSFWRFNEASDMWELYHSSGLIEWGSTPGATAEAACECGAAKLGHARNAPGHSDWCPWSGK